MMMNTDDLCELQENIKSKEDFIKFLYKFLENFNEFPEEWQNNNLVDFLNGFIGIVTT